jgi:Nickel responsive protein SCO4226-like
VDVSGGGEAKSYLVECYWPDVSEQKVSAAASRTREAAHGLRSQGRELRFLGLIFVPADETVFCLFDGDEADVRAVSEQAGIPFARVLESLRIDGNQHQRGKSAHFGTRLPRPPHPRTTPP